MALCISAIPRIIYISKKKKLLDQPDSDRKVHKEVIPNLGGVGIFLGFSVIASLLINPEEFTKFNYILAAAFILCITGIKDDLINVNPAKKLIAQIAASTIVVLLADIRLEHLHGFLGIYQMPYWLSFGISVIGYTFISNAFNLIDGIDGLAGSIAVICTFFLGFSFAVTNNYSPAIICFSLMGAIIGFLRFNYQPARIFMGDSGSLVIGFVIAVLSVVLTQRTQHFTGNMLFHSPRGVLLGALSLLFIPVFDTFRVFGTRLMKGHSPFRADRTHLHHYLLDLGFSHMKTVIILCLSSLAIIATTFFIQDYPVNVSLAIIVLTSCALFALLFFTRRSRMSDPLEPKAKKNKLIL
jgi:UDP-N-acetylmuramyl pentapeptide phosphotransferase/UDP-N-acetylglucosamine-1-phosphate transferase